MVVVVFDTCQLLLKYINNTLQSLICRPAQWESVRLLLTHFNFSWVNKLLLWGWDWCQWHDSRVPTATRATTFHQLSRQKYGQLPWHSFQLFPIDQIALTSPSFPSSSPFHWLFVSVPATPTAPSLRGSLSIPTLPVSITLEATPIHLCLTKHCGEKKARLGRSLDWTSRI